MERELFSPVVIGQNVVSSETVVTLYGADGSPTRGWEPVVIALR